MVTTKTHSSACSTTIPVQYRLCVANLSAHELMSDDPIAVRKDERVDSVWQILEHIHHVVVKDDLENIVGLVSHRDLMRWSGAFIGKVLPIQSSVEVILQPFARSVGVNTSLRTVAIEMLDNKFGCMPLTDSGGKLKGIITETDFVTFFSSVEWSHPVRRGQKVDFLTEEVTERTSPVVEKLRREIRELGLKVADFMTHPVRTVKVTDSLDTIDSLMRRYHFRHVPITEENGKLAGLMSQRDYLRVAVPDFSNGTRLEKNIKNAKIPVSHYMQREIVTTSPDMPLAQAADLMLTHKIGCLPVLEGDQLAGILSRSDFVRMFAEGV